jgi:nicotinic acetylcholine receptor
MKMHIFCSYLIIISFIKTISNQNLSDVATITDMILKSYKKSIRPDWKTPMRFEITFNQIMNIDEKNQIMQSSFYLKLSWNDQRLTWNTTEFNVKSFLIPATSIWLPDLYIINTADTNGFVNVNSLNYAMLDHKGNLYLIINLSMLKTQCKMNILYYPFDKQSCPIQIGAWQYDNSRLAFDADGTGIDLTNYLENSLWSLSEIKAHGISAKSRYNSNLNGTDIEFKIHIKRRPTTNMLNNLFPCFILNIVTLATYWIPFNLQITASI